MGYIVVTIILTVLGEWANTKARALSPDIKYMTRGEALAVRVPRALFFLCFILSILGPIYWSYLMDFINDLNGVPADTFAPVGANDIPKSEEDWTNQLFGVGFLVTITLLPLRSLFVLFQWVRTRFDPAYAEQQVKRPSIWFTLGVKSQSGRRRGGGDDDFSGRGGSFGGGGATGRW